MSIYSTGVGCLSDVADVVTSWWNSTAPNHTTMLLYGLKVDGQDSHIHANVITVPGMTMVLLMLTKDSVCVRWNWMLLSWEALGLRLIEVDTNKALHVSLTRS